jgi:acyl-CoA synthetase (AMP-forming)/AMP-acid ligase II
MVMMMMMVMVMILIMIMMTTTTTLTVSTMTWQAQVSWLPQYHDMGLIGSYLGLMYCGGSGFYMSPFSFIRNPLLWPATISKYRGTHTQVGERKGGRRR